MSKFKVGQKVVRVTQWSCINSDWKGAPIHKGEIHIVREVLADPVDGEVCLRFEGIINPLNAWGEEFAYTAHSFAPIIESSAEFVEVAFTRIIESTPKICAS